MNLEPANNERDWKSDEKDAHAQPRDFEKWTYRTLGIVDEGEAQSLKPAKAVQDYLELHPGEFRKHAEGWARHAAREDAVRRLNPDDLRRIAGR